MSSALSFLNTQLLPGRRNINGCPLLRVCVHGVCVCLCVCVCFGWVKCRAQIPSIGYHTWSYITSLCHKIFGLWPFDQFEFLVLPKFLVHLLCVCVCVYMYIYIYISGGPLSALTCCVNVRLLSAIKKISPLIYSQSWVGSWVYTTQAMMTFTLIF